MAGRMGVCTLLDGVFPSYRGCEDESAPPKWPSKSLSLDLLAVTLLAKTRLNQLDFVTRLGNQKAFFLFLSPPPLIFYNHLFVRYFGSPRLLYILSSSSPHLLTEDLFSAKDKSSKILIRATSLLPIICNPQHSGIATPDNFQLCNYSAQHPTLSRFASIGRLPQSFLSLQHYFPTLALDRDFHFNAFKLAGVTIATISLIRPLLGTGIAYMFFCGTTTRPP